MYCLFGLPFDAVSLAAAEQRIRAAAEQRLPCFLSTPNLNFLVACQTDAAFRYSVINSDLSVADGIPLVWLSKLLGIPIRERVAGSTLFDRLRNGSGTSLSVFFFGGPDGVAEKACRQLSSKGTGLACAGHASPGFGSVEDLSTEEIFQRINASNADFLVVALGARKGQVWIERNRRRIDVPVISHLGAVVKFVAGTVNRAPAWMQDAGMEWLWRIKEEPGLAGRYLYDGLMFLQMLVTRAIPYALFMYRHKPEKRELEPADVEVHDEGDEIVVRLRGPWVQDNLTPLRECFSRAALAGKDVRIDLEHVSYVDSSFLGLLLLLSGAQAKNSRRLSCGPVNREVRKIFEYGCSEFLLDHSKPYKESVTSGGLS